MGSAVSIGHDLLNEAECKTIAGIYWDERIFNRLKNNEGKITRAQFLKEVDCQEVRMRDKFCDVNQIFAKSLWEPLIMSCYFDVLHNADFGAYLAYDQANLELRRTLILESARQSHILLDLLYCEHSCRCLFRAGVTCGGSNRASDNIAVNTRLITEDKAQQNVWTDFDTADPDEIAVHLWTYSMSGVSPDSQRGKGIRKGDIVPFYKRVNMALLMDDKDTLNRMSFLICGIIRWIRRNAVVNASELEEDLILFRGTPINEEQQHHMGAALEARDSCTVSVQAHEKSAKIFLMPLFVAASASLSKAQQFCWVRSNGVGATLISFSLELHHPDVFACFILHTLPMQLCIPLILFFFSYSVPYSRVSGQEGGSCGLSGGN